MYGLCGLWLPACGDLAKGCTASTFFMGISNCREIPCAAQLRRSTVNWLMVRRSAVGAASQIHRESNHGETGNGDPLWGLKPAVLARPNHGNYFRSNIMVVWNRFMVLSNHGSFPLWAPRNSARYWTGTPTLGGAGFRKLKRLRSFEKLLKHPTSKDNVGYLNHRLLAMVSIGYRQWSIGAAAV